MESLNLTSGIYKITNKITGKVYVGSSLNIGLRHQAHLARLRNGYHHNTELQKDFDRYGSDAFELEVIEEIPESNPDLMHQREKFWIKYYPYTYNTGHQLGTGRRSRSIEKDGIDISRIEKVTLDGIEYTTIKALADYYKITRSSITFWIASGAFPNYFIHKRKTYIPISDLEPYICKP